MNDLRIGNWITMTYDLAGRQQSISNELGYTATTMYDASSRPITILDANGWLKTMIYDANGRNLGTAYGDGTFSTFAYDPVGNRTTMMDSTGITSYSFSPRHELTGKSDPGSLVQAYGYDPVGNRTNLVDPDGGIFSYSYDPIGRKTVQILPSGRIFTGAYDEAGRRTTLLLGFGESQIQGFDAVGRVTTQIYFDGAGAPYTTIIDTFDAAGRKTAQNKNGVNYAYVYDNSGRLTKQGGSLGNGVTNFDMDALGNVTKKTEETSGYLANVEMSYNAASQLLTMTSGGVTTYSFDNNGSMTREVLGNVATNYTYDRENRLAAVMNGIDPTSYTYDGTGLRRSRQWVQSGVSKTTTYIWDGTDYLGEVN